MAGHAGNRQVIIGVEMPDGLSFRRGDLLVHLGAADAVELVNFATVAMASSHDWAVLVRDVGARISATSFCGTPTVVLIEATASATSVFVHGAIAVDLDLASGSVLVDGARAATWIEQTLGALTGSIRIAAGSGLSAPTELPTAAGECQAPNPPGPGDPESTITFGHVDAVRELGSESHGRGANEGLVAPDDEPTIGRGAWDSRIADRTVVRDPERMHSRHASVVAASSNRPSDPVLTPGHVRGLACTAGHPNRPTDAECRTCGAVLADDLGTVTGPRPALGWLLIDDGRNIQLTQPCLIGRKPPDDHTIGGEPALAVHLDDSQQHISQRHLEIHLVGWDVRAIDCGSTNGTKHRRAGSRRAGPMKPFDQLTLAPGDVLQLGERSITFATSPP